jgi:hypothetical protein
VIWFGAFWKDAYYYLINQHVFLSCFLCHQNNPFSRNERRVFLVCYLLAALFSSYYIADHTPAPPPYTDEFLGLTVLSALILGAYAELMKFLSTCPCMAPGGCCERGCDTCPVCFRGLKEFLEELGHAGLVLALGVSGVLAAWVVITMMATCDNTGDFFRLLGDTLWAWFQGVLIGWAVNVAQFFVFFVYFNHAQQAVYAGTKGETAAYPSPGMPSVEYLEKSDSHNLEAVEKCMTCGEDTATV